MPLPPNRPAMKKAKGKRFSHAVVKKCILLYLQGKSYREIGTDLNIRDTQAVGILRQQYFNKGGKRRGTHPKKQGQRHNRAKLSDAQVLEMLHAYNEQLCSYGELAEKYGLHYATVRDIIKGRSRTDNPEINAYRNAMQIRDGRGRRKVAPATKKAETPPGASGE